jgi:Uncharacterized protein conserved in bacteria
MALKTKKIVRFISNMNQKPEFRYYYSTPKYHLTIRFYKEILEWKIFNSWDRGDLQRGTIFLSPNLTGMIEIEEGSSEPAFSGGLYIEIKDIDAWYQQLLQKKFELLQPLFVTSYGHRNFRISDPNGLSIGFFTYEKQL